MPWWAWKRGMTMTERELQEYTGPVIYRPFADVFPERGIYGGLTKAGWAYVWFEGKDAPEEVEPWCLTVAQR
jgi:hypothetical protein